MINLVEDTINNSDIDDLIQWLKTYPRLTKGPLTVEFEKKWAEYTGTKEAIFVNSGSSANLVMLQVLLETGKVKRGSNIIVPALAWATDLSPVVQLGFNPILCDCNLEDLSISLDHFEELCSTHDISAVMFVSVLGLVPDMSRLLDICKANDVILLEDTCESFGSRYTENKMGTFGLMSTFSTYFGHHLSTIEDLSDKKKLELRKEWDVSEFDSLYTFYMHGFNVRSTDLQAFIGIGQLDKADKVNALRERNFSIYQDNIKNSYWKPQYRENSFISNFAYPIIHPKRDEIAKKLIAHKVEVRPMLCRSMGVQPFYIKEYGKCILDNAEIVDKYGMYVPNHPGLTEKSIKLICDIVNTVIGE